MVRKLALVPLENRSRRTLVKTHSSQGADMSATPEPEPVLSRLAAALKAVMGALHKAGGGLPAPHPLGLLASAVFIPAGLEGGFMGGLTEMYNNQVFMTGYFAWLFAQLLKVPTHFLTTGVWRLKAMVDAGGMPSSHSSLCMGVTTAIAIKEGLGSSAFPMALAFSLIVMYDAAGVRRHAGKQAEVINKIVSAGNLLGLEISKPLKEVLGHTPVQVFAGALLGVVVAIGYATYCC